VGISLHCGPLRPNFVRTAFRVVGSAVLAIGLLCPDSVQAQTPVGKTTQQTPQARTLADSKVSLQNGAFTSGVEVQVPAYHGITPEISLAYNSASGNQATLWQTAMASRWHPVPFPSQRKCSLRKSSKLESGEEFGVARWH
jgi:hypothetical protein